MLIRIITFTLLVLNLILSSIFNPVASIRSIDISNNSNNVNVVKHHAEELNLKENKLYSKAEKLNLHHDKALKRKVRHYLNDYFNKSNMLNQTKLPKSLIQNKKFIQQLYDYLSKLFYVDLVLYNKVNYEKKNRIVRKIFKETNCELEVNLIDDKNWRCFTHVNEDNVNEIPFCSCSYEYDCDYSEQLSLGFSLKNLSQSFLDEVKQLCENNMNQDGHEVWSCEVAADSQRSDENQQVANNNEPKDDNDEEKEEEEEEKEAICDCTAKKKCEMQKILEHV